MVLAFGCASPGMPPGGPPDIAAPQIVGIAPDSGTLGASPNEVIFRFDEVVAERPPSATTLADLFLISPRDGAANVSWHRSTVGVRPRRGWRPNTAYTVIMLPGIADIRGNVRNTGAATFFSTGSAIPPTRIAGRVFDWVAGAPAKGALVESFVRPDSLRPYIALTDSNGAFVIQHLPPARYTVRAYLDANKNLGIDPSEPWDSVSISLADTAAVTLLMFKHDSLPPRIRDVNLVDSVTLRVAFDVPLDPAQTLTTANFSIIGPDSAAVPIASVTPAVTRADTTKATMPRPAPASDVVIKLERPLAPRTTFRVRAIGLRGILGQTGDSERPLTTPAPTPPPPPAKPAAVPTASPPPGKP